MNPDLADHAERTIQAGSKSFAVAARLFEPRTRRSAVMLYAWCRHCDDIIDGQELGHGSTGPGGVAATQELTVLQGKLRQAYEGRPPDSAAFAALQEVAQRHGIPERYPREHLVGYAMDVHERQYETLDDTLEYCYHVAGVVGIMMAQIMGVEDEPTLDRACDLGLAFQLTNIARDIVEDAGAGRCYLPALWLQEMGIPREELAGSRYRPALAILARRLLTAAEPYYESARAGLAALPWRSAWAVATALAVYRQIGVQVQVRGAAAWDGRVSTGRRDKLRLLVRALGDVVSSRRRVPGPRPDELWQRPCHGGSGSAPRGVCAADA